MKIYVCVGSSCHLKGSYEIVNILKRKLEENNLNDLVILSASFCLGHCSQEGVTIKIGEELFNINVGQVDQFFEDEILKKIGR